MYALFFTFLFGISSYHILPDIKQEKPEIVAWNKDSRLKWDDFQGIPEDDPFTVAAITYAGIAYKYNYTFNKNGEGKFTFRVNSYFDKSKSWVKIRHATKWILSHEQLHFDIAELYTRRLRKGFKEASLSKEGYEEEIILIHYNIYVEYLRVQKKYDQETHHSTIRKVQKEWNAYIESSLKDLEAYASPVVGPVMSSPPIGSLEQK